MWTAAPTLCICLLGCIIPMAAGAVNHPGRNGSGVEDELRPVKQFTTRGLVCSQNRQPWHVALFINNSVECSGALVHPQWVVTAAHCWSSSYTVRLGLQRLSELNGTGVQMIESNYSVKHPNYERRFNGSDIMLIKLKRPALESDTVRTIPITSKCPKPGTVCLSSAWRGHFNIKYHEERQCTLLRVQSQKKCRALYRHLYPRTEFCAVGSGGQETCDGDFGAPVSCDGILYGVVAWRFFPCGPNGFPGVYTNICKFQAWIQRTIASS